ncbi:histone deacetylase [Alteromonas aestuariivivens]|uniref:Histone deacetylase n=1 Tax=Alteromonas aestuariivivens TaxID=1938339 RepID=A0A3D8MGE0_9ALTE|nr:histone deacetylase [Alteromonas aestuariivivens]RDV29288.1 histone deacetylase [Alteromonas aestuariivivens]
MTVNPPLVFHPIYSQLPLPPRHRFPIEKYQGIRDQLEKLGVPDSQFVRPNPILPAQLNTHFCSSYVSSLLQGTLDPKAMRRIGFPWSEQLIKRSLTAVGGTCLTAQLAVKQGLALNLTGGYHHAFDNYGSGFCLFNDLYLAAHEMLAEPGVERVLIIDCDVHQGDGTAYLCRDNPAIATLSLHGEKNFPHRKQVSDMDFPLPKDTDDEQYLNTLDEALHLAFRHYAPDAVIYDAGVDIHQDDDLGLLAVTTKGVRARDDMVLAACRGKRLSTACVIGGGYQRDIDALVQVHMQLFLAAGLAI